jgi:hypothetical protein
VLARLADQLANPEMQDCVIVSARRNYGGEVMKRSSVIAALTFVGLFTAVAADGRSAAVQAAKPKAAKSATGAANRGMTRQQAAALKLGWDNLWRGYADLLSTPPDVKGDTSKLEGHMRAAMNDLHVVDPGAMQAAPANIPVEDKGHTRQFILDAVRGHLEKAKRVIEGAKVGNPSVQQALQNIAVAETDLTEIAQAAPKK